MKKEYHFKDCKNVLHIGGHKGQESLIYKKIGVDFTFVEPIKKLADYIKLKGNKVLNVAVSNTRSKSRFYVTKWSQRSSLLLPDESIAIVDKIIEVETVLLSDIQDGFDGLAIDAQGSTYDILKYGDLSKFKVIVCESSIVPRYSKEKSKESIECLLENSDLLKVVEYPHPDKNIIDLVYRKG